MPGKRSPDPSDPHRDQPLLHQGPRPSEARLALILIHGRGGDAQDMLALAREFPSEDVALFAPQAAGHSWYPYSFMAPIEQNEPWITSGLRTIARLLETLAREGLDPDRVMLLGFSQGACLALTFAALHPQRYGAVFGLSGGLIGPVGAVLANPGSMEGTPVFLGCSDRDPHIPLERVHETAEMFRRDDASVDLRIFPNMGHTVNREEIEAVRDLIASVPNR